MQKTVYNQLITIRFHGFTPGVLCCLTRRGDFFSSHGEREGEAGAPMKVGRGLMPSEGATQASA
jgi:hypothetical protein